MQPWQPEISGKCAQLRLQGRVEGSCYQQFLRLEHWLDDQRLRRLILCLDEVEAFDAHAFDGLVHLATMMQIRRGDVCLVAPNSEIRQRMAASSLDQAIEIRATPAEARTYLESNLWF